MIPPLRAQAIAALEAAGFRSSEHHLPTYSSGGCFSAIGSDSTSVNVTVMRWDATRAELTELLAPRWPPRCARLDSGWTTSGPGCTFGRRRELAYSPRRQRKAGTAAKTATARSHLALESDTSARLVLGQWAAVWTRLLILSRSLVREKANDQDHDRDYRYKRATPRQDRRRNLRSAKPCHDARAYGNEQRENYSYS
jgi:hypothetical protein